MPNINDLQLSSESDELEHPNIDKKSLIEFKRAEKLKRKHAKEQELKFLIENNGDPERIKNLQFDLSEKVKITSEKTVFGQENKEDETEDIIKHISFLLNHANLRDFVDYIDSHNVCLPTLEDNVLYNMSESIKSGNDEVGVDFARISMFIKCMKQDGGNIIRKLVSDMTFNDYKKFDGECMLYYEEAKKSILALYNEEKR